MQLHDNKATFLPDSFVIFFLSADLYIKIFCLETWAEIIFSWPTFFIRCDAPILYKIKN